MKTMKKMIPNTEKQKYKSDFDALCDIVSKDQSAFGKPTLWTKMQRFVWCKLGIRPGPRNG